MNMPLSDLSVGFIGLGNMGLPMARQIHEAGANVRVWNRSPGPAETAASIGMQSRASLSALAESVGDGILCLALTDTAAVESVLFGENGLASTLHPDALMIDFGTTGVQETRTFANRRPHWVDAPVSGGQEGAKAGNLTVMVGGTDEDVHRGWPILEAVGRNINHLGPVGSGQVAKLANQLIVAQTIDAIAQALRLAELSGLDSDKVRQALLGGFAESRILDVHGSRMVRRDFEPGGRAALQLKDIRLICDLAKSLGFASPTLDNCLAQWTTFVEEQGQGEVDHAGLFMMYE